MENCSVCGKPACIHLEIWQGRKETKEWRCLEHAEEVEAACDKVPGDFVKRLEVLPVIGMGATAGYGSDSYPYTVIAISANGKTITVQADDHKPAPGHHYINNQVYTYSPNPEGETKVFTLRDNGRWVLKGEGKKNGLRLGLGHRRYYQDPSF